MSLPRLKAELWRQVSLYVRHSRASAGMVRCFTCHTFHPVSQMDAGHLFSRRILATCFDLRNLRPQCPRCNRMELGKPEVFRARLIDEIGQAEFDRLEQLSRTVPKFTQAWYREQIARFRAMNSSLERILHVS